MQIRSGIVGLNRIMSIHLEAKSDKWEELTPIPNAQCLFCTGVKHGRDDQEAGGNCALADAKDEAHGEQSTKGLASRVRAQCDRPDEYIDARKRQRHGCISIQLFSYSSGKSQISDHRKHGQVDGTGTAGSLIGALQKTTG